MGLFDRMFKGAGKAQKAPEGPRVLSPADGELVAIESVADPVFAEKTMGDGVTAGQTVVTMDADAVRAAGYDPTVMVVVLEAPAGMTMRKRGPGPVKVGEPVIWFE